MAGLPIKIKDEDILDSLKADMDKAKSIQDTLSVQREEYYSRYRGVAYGNERPGWSQSVAPVIANNLNWSLPSMMEIFHEEYFTLKGENLEIPQPEPPQMPQGGQMMPPQAPQPEPPDGEERADNFQKLIYYQMFRKQDGYRRMYDFLYNAYLYHYAIFKVFYKEDFDLDYEVHDSLTTEEMIQLAQTPNVTITKYTETQDELGVIVYEKVKTATKKVNYAGPVLECIPPWEFYYSPDCKVGDWGSLDGRLVFHEVTRTMNDIRKKERAGIYRKGSYEKVLANFEGAVRPEAKPDSYEILIGADDVASIDSDAPETNELAKEITVRECYYRLDIDGDGLLEPVIVYLCGEIILQVDENPYKRPCFRIGSINPEPHKVTGIAMPKTLENDQKVMTNLLRLIQDSAAQSAYRNPVTSDQNMFKMLQDRKPFAVILGSPDKLGEVKQAAPDQFILRAYEMMKQENEEKTGNTRYNQGTDSASLNKTATGISAIFNASEKRMRLTAALMGNGPFKGIIQDFIFINQRWPSDDPIKLLGTKIEINPDDLAGEYTIDIDIGTSPSERQSIANQIDMFIQFGMKGGIQMGVVSPIGLMKAIKKKYRVLGVNVADCMVDEREFMRQMAEKQKQPPPDDWKEFVQIDKLYPLLARSEQLQILQHLQIQPDMNARVVGMPTAKDALAHIQDHSHVAQKQGMGQGMGQPQGMVQQGMPQQGIM